MTFHALEMKFLNSMTFQVFHDCTNPVTQRSNKASNNTKEFCSQAIAQTDHGEVLLTSASFENFRISFTDYESDYKNVLPNLLFEKAQLNDYITTNDTSITTRQL